MVDDPTGDTAPVFRQHRLPSAEDAAFAGPLVWDAVADATRRGVLSAASARVVLLHAAGHSLPELARRAEPRGPASTGCATGATRGSATTSPSPVEALLPDRGVSGETTRRLDRISRPNTRLSRRRLCGRHQMGDAA
jgi:hypothetical protein